MQINKKEKKYKEILSLYSEFRFLNDLKFKIEPIKLDKPIAHGYIRYLKVRAEYNLRGDLVLINEAFGLVGQRKAYSKNKDFLVKHKNHIQEKHARLGWATDPRYRFFYSHLQREKLVEKIRECEPHLKYVDQMIQCSCGASHCKAKDFLPHFEFKKPWLLEEKTEINWLTHYTPIDPKIESSLSRVKKKMIENHAWEILFGRRAVYDYDYGDDYGALKNEIHAYLHGYSRPRIEDFFLENLV